MMGRLHSLLLLLVGGGARTAGGARNRLNCMAHASRSTPFFPPAPLTSARSSSGHPSPPQKPVSPAVKNMPKVRPNRARQPSDIQTFTGLSLSLSLQRSGLSPSILAPRCLPSGSGKFAARPRSVLLVSPPLVIAVAVITRVFFEVFVPHAFFEVIEVHVR